MNMDAEEVIHTGDADEHEVPPDPPPPPRPVFVSKEDLLVSENMHLKALLIGREIEDIHQQIQKKMVEHQALEAKLRERRVELEAKYGINLLTHYIRESDGLVIPRPQQGTLQGILGQQIQSPPPANGVSG
jgi:hypothetical protein